MASKAESAYPGARHEIGFVTQKMEQHPVPLTTTGDIPGWLVGSLKALNECVGMARGISKVGS